MWMCVDGVEWVLVWSSVSVMTDFHHCVRFLSLLRLCTCVSFALFLFLLLSRAHCGDCVCVCVCVRVRTPALSIAAVSTCVGYFSSVDSAASSNVIGTSSNSSVVVGLGKAGTGVGSTRVRGVMTLTAATIGIVGGGCYAFQNAYGTFVCIRACARAHVCVCSPALSVVVIELTVSECALSVCMWMVACTGRLTGVKAPQ